MSGRISEAPYIPSHFPLDPPNLLSLLVDRNFSLKNLQRARKPHGQRTKRTLRSASSKRCCTRRRRQSAIAHDLNGASTTFSYDNENRLSRKDYPDHTYVSYTYTPAGQRQTVTDYRGIMSYQYDIRDRLTHVGNPDGSFWITDTTYRATALR